MLPPPPAACQRLYGLPVLENAPRGFATVLGPPVCCFQSENGFSGFNGSISGFAPDPGGLPTGFCFNFGGAGIRTFFTPIPPRGILGAVGTRTAGGLRPPFLRC